MQSQERSRCCDNLLLLGTCELSEDSLSDSGRWLDSQAVHEHGRSGRHLVAQVADYLRVVDLDNGGILMCCDVFWDENRWHAALLKLRFAYVAEQVTVRVGDVLVNRKSSSKR